MGLELRRLELSDRDRIAEIQAIVEEDPAFFVLTEGAAPGPTFVADEFAVIPPGVTYDQKWMFAGVENDRAIALLEGLTGYPDDATWYLGLIYVAPGARDRKCGTKLLEMITAAARASNARKLRLAVHVENTRARRLYDRLGYSFIARRTREVKGVAMECDVLELAL